MENFYKILKSKKYATQILKVKEIHLYREKIVRFFKSLPVHLY